MIIIAKIRGIQGGGNGVIAPSGQRWCLSKVMRHSPAVEWVNVVLESPRSFFAVLISMEGADQESG